MKEAWKDIEGYKNNYRISNMGKIKSIKLNKSKSLCPWKNTHNYLYIHLFKNGTVKTIALHLLVWDAFGNRQRNGKELQVDHKDENKSNCKISNLQLLTQRENISKYHKKKRILPTGVYYHKGAKKYLASIRDKDKRFYLGLFDNPINAGEAYQNKLNELI